MDTRFSAASIFTAYTSLTAILTLITQFYYQFVPELIRNYIASKIKQILNNPSRKESFTLVINQYDNDNYGSYNNLYKACEVYIPDKLQSSATRLRGSYENLNDPISYRITQGEEFVETLEKDGITLVWKLVCRNSRGEEDNDNTGHDRSIELCFDLAYKNKVLENHIPLVVVKYYEDMMKMKKDLFLYTIEGQDLEWKEVTFNHPFTFDVLALDPVQKQAIMDDLDMFIKRKEFYKRVGRAWKRGYLLYGPPGTGKSSLVAAMANYLKFDIYDLQLGGIQSDASLRKLMLSTKNKSILVIEDIDCTIGLSRDYNSKECDSEFDFDELCHSGENESEKKNEDQGDQETGQVNIKTNTKLSLSGLLNFTDGLWSSCGDERIYIFTTNVKEKLDPALLRPGRMDMHIHMSYLTMPGFRVLVKNYLGVTREHTLFKEIEQMLQIANVTPAQVAEELIRSDDADIALSSVVEMLALIGSL